MDDTHTVCMAQLQKLGKDSPCCGCYPHKGCLLKAKSLPNLEWKETFRNKWEGANTGGHGSIYTAMMDEMLVDIESTLDNALREQREEIFKNIFELDIHDSFGYGVGKINLHDLEEVAEKYGLDKEKLLELLSK